MTPNSAPCCGDAFVCRVHGCVVAGSLKDHEGCSECAKSTSNGGKCLGDSNIGRELMKGAM